MTVVAKDLVGAFTAAQATSIYKNVDRVLDPVTVSYTNVAYGGAAYATYTSATCKCKYTIGTSCSTIQLVYNSLLQGTIAGTPEVLPGNNFEIKVSLELSNGTLVPVWFGTNRLTLMKPGVTVVSNPVGVSLAAGEIVYVRTFINRIISNTFTNNIGEAGSITANLTNLVQSYSARGTVFTSSNEGAVFSVATGVDPFLQDFTDSGLVAGSNNIVYGPVEILGIPEVKNRKSVVVIGDSIASGAGDAAAPVGTVANTLFSEYALGLVNRAFGPLGIPLTKLAIGGETALEWVTNTVVFRRQRLINNSTALIMLGTNDIATGASAATVQTRLAAIVAKMRKYCDTIYVSTILPRASSTNGWTTLANQVPSTLGGSFTTTKNTVNDWLRGGGLPGVGIIDLADVAESSRNSGIWKAGTIAVSGTATGGSGTTIVDAGATWTTNQWYGYAATNLATGQSGYILSNTATTLTFTSAAAFSPVPGPGDAYSIALSWTADTVHPTSFGHAQLAAAIPANLFA